MNEEKLTHLSLAWATESYFETNQGLEHNLRHVYSEIVPFCTVGLTSRKMCIRLQHESLDFERTQGSQELGIKSISLQLPLNKVQVVKTPVLHLKLVGYLWAELWCLPLNKFAWRTCTSISQGTGNPVCWGYIGMHEL